VSNNENHTKVVLLIQHENKMWKNRFCRWSVFGGNPNRPSSLANALHL